MPHPSVTEALPRLLDELATRSLTATFFVEAINCERNPEAVQSIAQRGHEVAHHGWRHEQWSALEATEERNILSTGVSAFAMLGLRVTGFRPPGGELTARSPALLAETGFEWCSPAGNAPNPAGALDYIPFEWEMVDAYHLMERFAPLRERRKDHPDVLDPPAVAQRFEAAVDRLATRGGRRTLVMHPFLMLDDRWFDSVRALLDRMRELAAAGHLAVVPGNKIG